jgi:hypothetical protein
MDQLSAGGELRCYYVGEREYEFELFSSEQIDREIWVRRGGVAVSLRRGSGERVSQLVVLELQSKGRIRMSPRTGLKRDTASFELIPAVRLVVSNSK